MRVVPSGQACGATILGVDLAGPLSAGLVADIRAVWLEHLVLAFPDQPLDDDGLERFTCAMGGHGEDPFFAPVPGRQHIAAIRRRADETTPIFAESWHSDWSFLDPPPSATVLHARIIPPVGGDTLFSNQYAALEALPAQVRARIQGLNAWHSAARGYAPDGLYGAGDKGRSMDIRPSEEARKRRLQPMVRRHPETGREALFVNPGYTVAIEGLEPAESQALLVDLFTHQTQEQFQYRHAWRDGMLLMWDNRCLLHRATGGYDGYDRLLHRATVAGP